MARNPITSHKPIFSPKLKVFRTHIGFDDLIIAAPSRKAALEAWGASAHLFSQGFAAETNEPALVKAALARPGMVLRRQFGSRAEFKAGALRLVEPPARPEPKQVAKAPAKKPASKRTEREGLQEPAPDRVPQKPAQRDQAAAERKERRDRAESQRAERRAAEAEARAEARQQEKQREKEQKEAAAEHRRDLQSQLQSIQDERKQQLCDIDRREQELARERREIEQSFETRIVALRRQLRKA
jgi:hypothetical protein